MNANQALNLFEALFKDFEEVIDLVPGTLKCDFEKITRFVNSRGYESVFLIRFPQLCKDFEKSLETGLEEASVGEFARKGKFTILRPLFDRVFTSEGYLRLNSCIESIRAIRQAFKLLKKVRVDCPVSAKMEKIHEFVEIEAGLPIPNLCWGSDDLYPHRLLGFPYGVPGIAEDLKVVLRVHDQGWSDREFSETIADLRRIQYSADKTFGTFRVSRKDFKPKHGPGAVAEKFRNSKFEFPSWPPRLDERFPFLEWGCFNQLAHELKGCNGQAPAKLIDVPKDYSGPRLIASEPISSQYIQQGIMRAIRKCLRTSPLRHCYSPNSQEPSRSLVIRASEDRSLSTIDLSSASDRLSCLVVESIFRCNPDFLMDLNAARTHEIIVPGRPFELEMRKFAAQGAAFTFPIQTLVYAIISVGVVLNTFDGIGFNQACRMVRVYGDDIIVPTVCHKRVCRVLQALFLKVNDAKSFYLGFFRESCGMDAYKGHDVTPASVLSTFSTRDPSTVMSVVECSNNLYRKGYWNCSTILLQTIPKRMLDRIPAVRDGSNVPLGIVCSGKKPLKTRTNANWQCTEVQVLTVESKLTYSRPEGTHRLFQWFVEEPPADRKWSAGVVRSVKARCRLRWVSSHRLEAL